MQPIHRIGEKPFQPRRRAVWQSGRKGALAEKCFDKLVGADWKFEATPADVRILRADSDCVIAADQKRTRGAVLQIVSESDPPITPVPIDIDRERSLFGRSE